MRFQTRKFEKANLTAWGNTQRGWTVADLNGQRVAEIQCLGPSGHPERYRVYRVGHRRASKPLGQAQTLAAGIDLLVEHGVGQVS